MSFSAKEKMRKYLHELVTQFQEASSHSDCVKGLLTVNPDQTAFESRANHLGKSASASKSQTSFPVVFRINYIELRNYTGLFHF